MTLNRRQLLIFLGATIGTGIAHALPSQSKPNLPKSGLPKNSGRLSNNAAAGLRFQPIQGPIPLPTSPLPPDQQIAALSTYEVVDDLVLPIGYTYDVIAAWGDPIGDSRCGYNNDYLSLLETSPDEGLLTINFEYVSAVSWQQTFATVIGRSLPLEEVQAAVRAANSGSGDRKGLNAFALSERDPLKRSIQKICQEALIDQGLGVIALRRRADGRWERNPSQYDRRITGLSGLADDRYLAATGPARTIFQKTQGQGYLDKLGTRIVGTFQNCAGGTTPWGTVLSGEENIQVQVPELVYSDGTSFDPSHCPFNITNEELVGLGNVYGLAGNKYGWMVEIDPSNPSDPGTKHTWLGRYRHEAVGVRVVVGKPLTFYSGCDRRGGHLYKFVSRDRVTNLRDKTNSQLLQNGMLYAAQFDRNGTGHWIPLQPSTPVQPTPLEQLGGGMLPLPLRPEGGVFKAETPDQLTAFQKRFKTLGDLYSGSPAEKQGAILIDAHYAANAAGATCTARPEDTEIAPDGSLFIAFTSGAPSQDEGSPDRRIFVGPKGETAYEHGWIMQLMEDQNEPGARSFRWRMVVTGGEPPAGGFGFSNPDNLVFDRAGNLWMMTDISSDKLNRAVPRDRQERDGTRISESNLRGIFGNNSVWCIPLVGPSAGQPHLFGLGPMDCEMTGPWFTTDQKTLFLSVQHPGDFGGMRQNGATETRPMAVRTTHGREFMQQRSVPIGSNWPGKQPSDPPKPAIVAIYRRDQQPI